ncbi:MAG TPA: squalene synthase HpnC [Gemmatimonadota bacterium]|nr:squalene synthase HpnC [Gemmatimonadota bacterium]
MPDSRPAPRAEDRAERAAHAACARLARSHYENFPVRGPLLRSAERRDLAAVYAFCRTTDDLGDEAEGDRGVLLAQWRLKLEEALVGRPDAGQPVLVALARTARERGLEADLFFRIVEANRRDQEVSWYSDREALLEYCRHSATPVGRMVLGVAGARGADLTAFSDATCIGLQLANFWQDLAGDHRRGRCYLPLEDCDRHGVDPEVELARTSASPALRSLVAEEVSWAREHLARGWPLAERLPVRWRPLVRAFTRGGWAICDAIAALDHDTLTRRPSLSARARRRLLLSEYARAWRTVVPAPTVA